MPRLIAPGHHRCPVWGVFAVVPRAEDGDWRPDLVMGGITLAQARNLADEMGAVLIFR